MADAVLKEFFSHLVIAEILIRRLLPDRVDRLDFSTLQQAPTEMVLRGRTVRHLDLAWTCLTKDGSEELLVLPELQGEPRRNMPRRMVIYKLCALDEREQHYRERKLAVSVHAEPFVLHHGIRRWTAPMRDVAGVGPKSMDAYELVPPRPLGEPDPELFDLPVLVMGLFRGLTGEELVTEMLLCRSVVRAADEDLDGLVHAPDVSQEDAESLEDIVDKALVGVLRSTKANTNLKIDLQGKEKGLDSTISRFEQSLQDLRSEGRRDQLRRMAARRFGADAAREFGTLLDGMDDQERLDQAGDAVIDCDEAGALLSRARSLATG